MLLSHEVNGRICSRTQGAQEFEIIEARGAESTVGIDGASGSLEIRSVVREVNFKSDWAGFEGSPLLSAPANERMIESGIEVWC